MALTYERCWSREQIRDARLFFFANFAQKDENSVGCGPGTDQTLMTRLIDEHYVDRIIWLTARDGDAIVAAYVVATENPGPDRPRWRILGLALDKSFDQEELYLNMMIAVAEIVMAPGDRWVTAMPPGPPVDFTLASPFGESSSVLPTEIPLVNVIGIVPDPMPGHTL